jgi:hypothetical protein
MDLKNEFVPYQIALDLKSLGFDEPCLASWTYKTKEKIPTLYGCGALLFDIDGLITNQTEDIICSAPLYQQCWRWFREKYGLYFNIHRLQHKIGTKQEFMLIINAPLRGGYYETYEQAEFECLFRLIEIVKQKI